MSESIAADQLKSLVDRIEKLEEEKDGLTNDIREVYNEAKGSGFDVKAMRRIIAIRKKDYSEVQQEESMLELYKSALGMG